jgi:uncharacterized protein YbcI
MAADEQAPAAAVVRADIASEILRVHHESYGTGASNVDVHLGDDIVLVVIDIELSPAERTLLDADHGEAVRHTRESFQEVIAPVFIAIIERATGRRVESFLSSVSIAPLYATEFFRLVPEE